MAQANSVPREPSMEEILASIRRIIEDSDTARPMSEAPRAEAQPAPQAASAEVVDVEAFRAETRDYAPDVAPQRPDATFVAENTETSRDRRIVEELRPSLGAFFDVAPEQAQAPAAEAAMPELDAPTLADSFEVPSVERDDPMLGMADFLDEALKEDVAPQAAPAAPAPSIISEQTGRQVAAAFGELTEAFAATRQKSFDEMAEAMLRPMLSDWLDNNLPTLVERLVREEIERIARGPAR
jgi:cell pole-organizing protein PopZ